jgi:iron complex transport system ATP-binding protein
MNSIIEVRNVSFGYTRQSTILSSISFDVAAGSFLAVAGPNGAGKSTLLNLLSRALTPKSGAISIDAAPIESYGTRSLASKIAVVRQEFVPVFGFSVIETVMMARTRHYGRVGFESETDREIVHEALEATDTAQFAARPLGSLSGGERQRVFIARALAQASDILLLDEPTSFLDLKHQVDIYDLLKVAQSEKDKTVVTVTHDINLAAQYCDEIMLLGGRPAGVGTPTSQTGQRTQDNYRIGKTQDVFSPEQIEEIFGVRVFAGEIGQEKFFFPLGRLAKDYRRIREARETGEQARSQQRPP